MSGITEREAHAAALAGLSAMTPARLRSLLRRHRPEVAWAVACGEHPDRVVESWFARSPELRQRWANDARMRPPGVLADRCVQARTNVLILGTDGYPPLLAGDPEAPAVLFAAGDPTVLAGRRAAIVGTRNATEGGRRLALRLGRELADAEVRVVSGLARGIDGAAHRGVLTSQGGPPVAVVASGPDVPFPKEHTDLWRAVVERGVVFSEHPPGAPPLAAWFPLRNRILAALSEVVVVVESRQRGGSLQTARLATERQIPVLAVPGSLLNRAAEGTNRLIADGCAAVLDTLDVLVALGLETTRLDGPGPDPRPRPSAADTRILDAFDGDPLTLDQVCLRAGEPIAAVALAVGRLEAAGWLVDTGGWFEPVAHPHPATRGMTR
ncbi:MAG: DNA-processing protein DprA [Ilumatobacteraceae bacterium]